MTAKSMRSRAAVRSRLSCLPDRLDRAFDVGDFHDQMVDLFASTVNPWALQFSTRVQAMLVI